MRRARQTTISWSELVARRERLARLRKAVLSGSYVVAPEAVARSILRRGSLIPRSAHAQQR